MSLWEIVPVLGQSSFEKHIRESMTQREVRHHEEFFGPLGLWIEVRAYPSQDGLSVLFRDITDRKQLEEEHARLYVESQNVNRIKDELLATLSHELRTPLNVTQGNAEILMTEGGNQMPEDLKSSVEAIYRNPRAQTNIIADLLDVSSIITGKFGFEPGEIAPREIVEVVVENNRRTAESKGVRLECEISNAPEKIVGDATRLQQILWNLVTNAIKFTPKGGVVTVRLTGSGEGLGEECVFQVADTGKGILPEFLSYMFERFRQEDSSTTRKYGGLSLGLASYQ